MSDQVCIILSDYPSLYVLTEQLKADMIKVAAEFGSKCGVFDMLGDTGKKFEEAMSKLMEAYAWLYQNIMNIINTINGLIQDGIDLLMSIINLALAALGSILDTINGIVNNAILALAKAVNDLMSAACSGLKTALSGVPSDVVLQTPGLLFLEYASANDPRALIQESLLRNGVGEINDLIDGPLGELRNFQNTYLFPDFTTYICL